MPLECDRDRNQKIFFYRSTQFGAYLIIFFDFMKKCINFIFGLWPKFLPGLFLLPNSEKINLTSIRIYLYFRIHQASLTIHYSALYLVPYLFHLQIIRPRMWIRGSEHFAHTHIAESPCFVYLMK